MLISIRPDLSGRLIRRSRIVCIGRGRAAVYCRALSSLASLSISLSDLGISNLYYDNGWVKAEIDIEISKLYPLNGENISGDTLLTSQAKFRFVWKSDPQFQFEGWYIDDVKIVVGEHPHNELVWQTHHVYWCAPFGSTITRTFPMEWNADKEGKYLNHSSYAIAREARPKQSP